MKVDDTDHPEETKSMYSADGNMDVTKDMSNNEYKNVIDYIFLENTSKIKKNYNFDIKLK